MGSFFSSIHFKTTDFSGVRTAAHAALSKKSKSALLAPVSKGWISLFPSADCDVEQLSRRITAAAKVERAIAFSLHDSDVLQYWYLHDGTVAGSFNSAPDYFGRATKAAMDATGDPRALGALLPALKRTRWKKLVTPRLINGEFIGGSVDTEEDRLEALAKLLGISNACTSYEYLREEPRGSMVELGAGATPAPKVPEAGVPRYKAFIVTGDAGLQPLSKGWETMEQISARAKARKGKRASASSQQSTPRARSARTLSRNPDRR